MRQNFFPFLQALLLFSGLMLHADPVSGWLQTGAGTYDYYAPENWVGGEVNGLFGADLTLTGAQTITFGEDSRLPQGLSIAFQGGYKLTFQSDDVSIPRTITLGDDLVLGTTAKNSGVTFANSLVLNLDGEQRTLSSANANASIVIHSTIENGALALQNVGRIDLNAANSYAGGTTLSGTGSVYVGKNCFGTGPVTIYEGAKIDVATTQTFTADNPLILHGNFTFSGTSGNLDFGSGAIYVKQPLTVSVAKNAFHLHGGILEGDLWDITKAGNGSFYTYTEAVISDDTEIRSSAGVWTIKGLISGTGRLIKVGDGSLELMESNTFTDVLVIREGVVRFRKANATAPATRILIEEKGLLRSNTGSECSYQYSVANILSLGIIDPASSGTLAFSSNESGSLDLSHYPHLKIGINGGNFTFSGTFFAPPGAPLVLGGGNTLTLSAENALSGIHDVSLLGNVTLSASNNLEGTLSVAPGKTLALGNTASLPNADVVVEGVFRLLAGTSGEFVRAKNVTLKTGELSLDTPSAGAVTHILSGALIADTRTQNGGVSQITGSGSTTHPLTLSVLEIIQAENNPCFLNIPATGLGDTIHILATNPPEGVDAGGTTGTLSAPIIPWIRNEGYFLQYNADQGLIALTPEIDQALYDSDSFTAFSVNAENTALLAATMTLPGDALLNSLSVRFSDSTDSHFIATNGTSQILSGALDLSAYANSAVRGSFDFGTRRGYISARVSTQKNAHLDFYADLSGSGGMSFSDCKSSADNKNFNLYANGSTYTGDTYVYGCLYPKSNTVFPHGPDRPGNLYVYGRISLVSVGDLQINGLNGNGDVASSGSGTSHITIGLDGSNGNFEGSFVNNPAGANFGLTKDGPGYQRMACDMGYKWECAVRGGTLQVDGSITLNRSDNIIVYDGGTLAGCGSFGGYTALRIKSGGTLAPGSAERPNNPMIITNIARKISIPLILEKDAALRFHIDRQRASQLLVSGDVQGAFQIPITIEGDTPQDQSWMLIEAPILEPTFVLVPGTYGSLSIVETDATQQLWYTQHPKRTLLLLR